MSKVTINHNIKPESQRLSIYTKKLCQTFSFTHAVEIMYQGVTGKTLELDEPLVCEYAQLTTGYKPDARRGVLWLDLWQCYKDNHIPGSDFVFIRDVRRITTLDEATGLLRAGKPLYAEARGHTTFKVEGYHYFYDENQLDVKVNKFQGQSSGAHAMLIDGYDYMSKNFLAMNWNDQYPRATIESENMGEYLTLYTFNLDIMPFTDMRGRSEEEIQAVQWMKDQGITKGFDDGTFRPDDNLTRGQYALIKYREANR